MDDAIAVPVRELQRPDRAALARHLLSLEGEDRRLRFGASLSDAGVRAYVASIDLERDALFGVYDHDLNLLGAAHVARTDGHAELGLSVLAGHRNRGLGGALLECACLRARSWGVRHLYMRCLTENAAMMHLARRHNMKIVTEAGEVDAWHALTPDHPASVRIVGSKPRLRAGERAAT